MFRIISGLLVLLTFFSCERKAFNSAPEIGFEIFPFAGDTLTAFHFDLSRTQDNEDIIENLLRRFDWNSDGIWDTEFGKLKPAIRLFAEGGIHKITVEVIDAEGMSSTAMDSLYVFPVPDYGELIDSRDGQKYRTVRLNNRWWMAEHLRYGSQISSGTIAKDDEQVEYYLLNDNQENLVRYGGLYARDEAMNYSIQEGATGVCPSGWHIPSSNEWKSISHSEARVLLGYLHGPGGPSGLNLQLGGSLMILQKWSFDMLENVFTPDNIASYFWSSSSGRRQLGVYDDKPVYQKFQIAYYINPSLNDHNNPQILGFNRQDNFFPGEGDPQYYVGRNLIVYQFYAYSIRCIKDI